MWLPPGVVPQISVIMGSCAGGAVYSPAITDFVFMVQGTSQMFITGPDVVKTVTGEDVTLEELGGAITHATKSGVACLWPPTKSRASTRCAGSSVIFPPTTSHAPAVMATDDDPLRAVPELADLVPSHPHQPHDMKDLVRAVLDGGDFFEYHALWALNLVCGFGRIGGRVVGVVANQPQVLAGVLDIDATEKGARFVRTCDCFNIPVVTFVDVPGFMPGTDQEHGGMARRAAKLALCLLRGDRTENPVDHAPGLRRRLCGHGLQIARGRLRLCVAGCRAGRRRPGKRRGHCSTARELAGAPPERRARTGRRLQGGQRQPVPGRRTRLHRRRHRPASTRRVLHQALEMLASKRQERSRP